MVMVSVVAFTFGPITQTLIIHLLNTTNVTDNVDFIITLEQDFYGLDVKRNLLHYFIFETCAVATNYWVAAMFGVTLATIQSIIKSSITLLKLVANRLDRLHEFSGPSLKQELSEIIDLHVDALSCLEQFESYIGWTMLLQLCNCVTIWIMLVLILSSSFDLNTFSVLVLLVVTTGETYAICKWATELSDASAAVGDVSFHAQWYNLPADVQRAHASVVQRAQKREGIKVAGFQYLDMALFEMLVRRSYSIFMVVRDQL
ncbi:odorant receptor 85b-like [Topomyia yanbarensis]|uniref:odorant receptor 85b-like n=1 Tax=Topomyia yanbarensis TaxID=2498891 RepID=UPI00273AFB0F|nr:odorant receptor 85b-like [Topomyia yanbarensis]